MDNQLKFLILLLLLLFCTISFFRDNKYVQVFIYRSLLRFARLID